MRKLLIAIPYLLAAGWLAAQVPTSTVQQPPPLLSTQTAASTALGVYQGWLETSISTLGANQSADEARQTTDEATINSLNSANSNLSAQVAALQGQITTLQQQVAALQAIVNPPATTITVQAESFNSFSGVTGTPCTQPGGTGTVTCNAQVDEILSYNVSVTTAGNYRFAVSAASNTGGTIVVNGTGVGIANTGGFAANQYQNASGPLLPLVAGMNIVSINFQSQHINLDYFTLTPQ